MFDAGKTRMNALPYGEKNYDDMLSRFHLIPKRNRRTDRRTDLLYQYRASVCWRAIKSNETISLKLDAVTGPTNRKNGLTFGGDGFRITLPLPSPLRNSGFWEIYQHFSHSHRPIFTKLGTMTDAESTNCDSHTDLNPGWLWPWWMFISLSSFLSRPL